MATEPARTPDRDWPRIAIALALAWFAVRLVAFAVAIDPSVPPDEETHVGRILAYAKTWSWPAAAPDNHALGLLGHRPFLYSWVLGRLAALGLDGLVALRLVNALLAMGTALYGLRFIRVVSAQPWTHVVFVVLLTNTLMFTGIGAAVSYDNATNLLAAASFYYAARIGRDGSLASLAPLLLAMGLGCLTKRSFLPLAVLIGAAVLVHERARLRDWRAAAGPFARPLWGAVAAVVLANAALYGGNYLRFGRLVPGFEQVVGTEAAKANRIYARDSILEGYREGRLSFQEAMRETAQIAHEGDRRSTAGQLAATRKRMRQDADWRLPLPDHAVWWGRIMFERSAGYFGHRVLLRAPWERVAFGAVLLLALCFHALAWRRSGAPGIRPAAAVALAYALVLLFLVNRPTYLEKGILDAGVQGRYLFPVWVPLMGFLAVGLFEDAPRRLRVPVSAAACALFVWSDAPSLWLRAGPEWFGG